MLFRRKKKRRAKPQNPKVVLIKQILIGIFLMLLVAGIGAGVWYGSRVDALTLQDTHIVGGETIPHDEIVEIAEEELAGTYYRLVPRRFAWTYPKHAIASRIDARERVKNVHVERVSGTELSIAFEEYRPFALWCEGVTDTTCLFLDHTGFAFGHAPKLQGGAFVRFSETGRTPTLNTDAFSGDFIQEAEVFIMRAYNELGLNIIHVEKTSSDAATYHVAGGGELKVSLQESADDTIENLETILASEEFDHIAPGNFQYIDLRYGNRIFVNEEIAAPEEEAATSSANEAAVSP